MEKRLRNAPLLARAREANLQSLQGIREKNDRMCRCGNFILIDEPASCQNFVVRRGAVDDYTNRPGILPGFNLARQTCSLSTSSSEKSVLCTHSGDRSHKGDDSLRIQYRRPYLYWGLSGANSWRFPETQERQRSWAPLEDRLPPQAEHQRRPGGTWLPLRRNIVAALPDHRCNPGGTSLPPSRRYESIQQAVTPPLGEQTHTLSWFRA